MRADEEAIRSVITQWVEAFRLKSATMSMAVHATDMVSFDIVPPLAYVGSSAYEKAWHAAFQLFDGPIEMTVHDLHIEIDRRLAFARSLNRFQGITRDGARSDYWFRWTACFRKSDGRWLLAHDHASLPTDFATGRSVADLQPT